MVVGFLPTRALCVFAEEPARKESKVFSMSTDSVGGHTLQPLLTSVRWKGREYGIEEGIDLAMSVVRCPRESAGNWNAATALGELANLGPHLKGRPCLDELARLYDHAQLPEKQIILTCLFASGDPRGIPVFIRTLEKEQNVKLRLRAAGALAQWNIRRGVAELVDLLESKEKLLLPGGLMPYVRDKALDLFRTKNRLKGWGFVDHGDEIAESIVSRTDINDDDKRALYFAEMKAAIKKWFAENEDRFPDWKLGDPLPETSSDKDKKVGEDKEVPKVKP